MPYFDISDMLFVFLYVYYHVDLKFYQLTVYITEIAPLVIVSNATPKHKKVR